ncbi:transcription elongation factor GreA [Patescibacteria group bacterium]|nr:transcription elongation factor GreA [Patescibacteria group bacterium]
MTNNNGQNYVTKDGLQKIKIELKELKTIKRKEIAWRIQEAKELGDLSENAEYVEAKTEQGFIEGKIIELENILKNVEVIPDSTGGDEVQVGSKVAFTSPQGDKEYTIVGSNEANPVMGLISNESPLGQAFLGRKVGDKVEVSLPVGRVIYKITKIS